MIRSGALPILSILLQQGGLGRCGLQAGPQRRYSSNQAPLLWPRGSDRQPRRRRFRQKRPRLARGRLRDRRPRNGHSGSTELAVLRSDLDHRPQHHRTLVRRRFDDIANLACAGICSSATIFLQDLTDRCEGRRDVQLPIRLV